MHKMKPVRVPAWMGIELMKSHSLAEELLVVHGYWEKRSQFSTVMRTLKAHDPILMHI